ncbi:MAG TPA: nucleoside transporter C-terminal domain-containing protein, partial [Lacipirellulaceae bacterium]|nr:nucleoside transporter C-terminal domain-containing protein [Lacipirellulaceae bacterium]
RWAGAQLGYIGDEGQYVWSLEALLGYLFMPLAWLVGVEWSDCGAAGQLMGLKMATNEFIAYGRLADWAAADSPVQISERTRTIMMYALGGIGGIAPSRRGDLARLGLRAMLGGTLTSFINACVASILL